MGKWGWFNWVFRVVELTRFNEKEVFEMNALDFLTRVAYLIDKSAEEKRIYNNFNKR